MSETNDSVIDVNEIVLVRELGRGTTATVYEATIPSGATFAVKSIDKSKMDQVGWQNFCREVTIMQKLNHKNVIKMHTLFQTDTQYHIVLDLVGNGELFDQIVQRGNFSEADAREIVLQIIAGVGYLHKNGIAHRDLKPENLLCQHDGTVVISDFGLSKFFERDQLLVTRCGTPAYSAPEIILGNPYSTAVDIWAIGVITYVLVSGISPFYGQVDTMFEQIVHGKYDFPEEQFSHVSAFAKSFISTLLQVDPSKRPTAEQCLTLPWITEPVSELSGYSIRDSMEDYNRLRHSASVNISY